MKKDKKFATSGEVEKAIKKLDLVRLLRELESFAIYKLHNHDKDKAFDVVGQAFEKLLSQERKWYKDDKLVDTLFGAVKSLCNNENKKLKRKKEGEQESVEIEELSSPKQRDQFEELNYEELKSIAIKTLKNHDPPPNYLEELIFECWIEGLTKQQEIALYLEEDIIEIRKGVKRLNRKLGPVKDKFIKMRYGQG